MDDSLFENFIPVSEKQWKQKIQFDLKGKEYNETLSTKTKDGIVINPIHHLDSYKQVVSDRSTHDFKIGQTIFIADERVANSIARKAIKGGVESILFKASGPFNIQIALKNIPIEIELQFEFEFLSESFLTDLINHTEKYTTLLNIDIIGNLGKEGNWFTTLQNDFKVFNALLKHTSQKSIVFGIDAANYQNSGATITQQIGFALAHGFEYINDFLNVTDEPTEKRLDFNVNFAIGSNYFFEIAKLRAFRTVWTSVCKDLRLQSKLHITASPSTRNKTLYDYNTNMLRTTSESMSAILGGANTVCNLAYDSIYHKSNAFGERIARNQLLILKKESYLSNANQMVNGSYYVEYLTKEIAEKSLELFKEIEKNGGFLKQLKLGNIQDSIEKSATKEQELFEDGSIVLLGTNKHTNTSDTMKNELELYPFVKTNPRKTLIKPIIAKRLSERLDQERLKNEA
ncbi:methylmalonyl-CoA mutase subunit beta [Urechidicola vernalis]|uniref:Methylmalonyl-CoA mutase subunit beta n=1 Tax=Urechidicola vernalis TaxID=3075600 RepID=A0ABU2Y3K8_9FLAO|nr:methylmalonyl-CoA mutase subunit beta [Urechidicola sp. P050]MDT0552786.1 methylmalonyl-CoA mutase subunit beta [Urechidicola sp. P050]